MLGQNSLAPISLKLELHAENSRAVFSKILVLVLGSFLFVFPATGLTVYFFLESAYLMYAATTVYLLSFVAIIYWGINIGKSVYQITFSSSGFSMSAIKTSPFMKHVNERYKWEDIDYYTYDLGDENSKLKLTLYFNSKIKLRFYYLGFKEFGDLPKFYHILCSHMPTKERKP